MNPINKKDFDRIKKSKITHTTSSVAPAKIKKAKKEEA